VALIALQMLAGPAGKAAQLLRHRDELCLQPLDIESDKVPSEVNETYDIHAEVAGDCWTDGPGTMTRVVWWGGYIDGDPGDPPVTTFDIRFYTDSGECTPDSLIAGLFAQPPVITYIGDDPNGYPTYMYELELDVDMPEGKFWFSVQGRTDQYPPLHGRAGDGGDIGGTCETVFRGDYFGIEYPEWTPIRDVVGGDWTASQFFEFRPGTTPVEPSTWGATKGLYR
jgi:hypothetical protein